MPASKAQRARTAERRTKAIQLRIAGMEYEQIAQQLEYASRGACYTDITRALERHVAQLRGTVDTLRQQELQRLDRLQAAAWSGALSGELKAIETVLKIIDRRCRLLGLDAPQRHEVVTLDAVDAEIARLSAELGVEPEPAGGGEAGEAATAAASP